MGKKQKLRLDDLLVFHKKAATVPEAEQLIRSGAVFVNEQCADKPGLEFPVDVELRVRRQPDFVSRGGTKLAGALDYFAIDPHGMICADIGASTGGFTDCLLQRGAKLVYAVDVAYGILDWKLRTDSRVIVRERLNARNLSSQHIDKPLDLAVCDTSFISLTKIILPLLPLFGSVIRIVALVKPQFELPAHMVAKGGIVQNDADRMKAVETIKSFSDAHGLAFNGMVASSIKGTKGNQEYLVFLNG